MSRTGGKSNLTNVQQNFKGFGDPAQQLYGIADDVFFVAALSITQCGLSVFTEFEFSRCY